MTRVPPSQRIAQLITEFLHTGIREETDVTSTLLKLGAQRLVQELLEAEVDDHLGRGHYQRRSVAEETPGYRNGYAHRRLKTAEGVIPLAVPQLRETEAPYRSRLLEFLRHHSEVLDQLVVEMYARGLSTRDIEDTFRDEVGQSLISRSGVSLVTEALWEEYETFSQRDLSGYRVEYLFLDAIYCANRPASARRSCAPGAFCLQPGAHGHQVLRSSHAFHIVPFTEEANASAKTLIPATDDKRFLLYLSWNAPFVRSKRR